MRNKRLFISLTDVDGIVYTVNVDHITDFSQRDEITLVSLIDGQTLLVSDTAESIIDMLDRFD